MHNHHGHHHHHGSNGNNNLALAFWLNTAFALIELVGGFFTNSVAIMSDALHDFGDSLALGTAWYFDRKAKGKRDEVYTYGYKRFSLIGALINAVVLTIGSVFILTEATQRLFDPTQPDADGMVLLALLGIMVNGIALLRLKKGTSVNERVISLHFVEDVLGWVAVLVGSLIMKFFNAPIIDPLLSVSIAGFILFNVYRNMREAFQIILQGVPQNVSEEQVKKELAVFSDIESTHDLHLWTLDGAYNILTTHIVLTKAIEVHALEELKFKIKERLKTINIQHATIEFEVQGIRCDQEHH
ncbi:MAG TPA: cation diffusion facilitator family transporter [Ohtaekwangia sp.]|nr:cation diffusion facilitator family transporter [Ohtaekwangia sp.]